MSNLSQAFALDHYYDARFHRYQRIHPGETVVLKSRVGIGSSFLEIIFSPEESFFKDRPEAEAYIRRKYPSQNQDGGINSFFIVRDIVPVLC